MIKCEYCGKEFSKYGIKNHIKLKHTDEGINFLKNRKDTFGDSRGWAKGLTKHTDERVARWGKSYSENIKSGKIVNSFKEKNHSELSRKQISDSMKKAHADGRANNWQDSKKHDNSSYPEVFFESVIHNEFSDKEFIREFRMNQFSIDFAWLHKKKAIEIDGQQHELDEHKKRDMKKDLLLKEQGWEVLRIKWIDIYNDTKKWIQIAKNFIDD